MNAKALAVAAAMGAAPAAVNAAELELYGTIGAAGEFLDNDTRQSGEVSNNHSVIGIKGSRELLPGVRGVFLADWFVGIDRGADPDSGGLFGEGRDGWVGLEGDAWGSVALGFQGRPWKTATHHLDPFEGTIADYSAIMGTISQVNDPGQIYFDGGIGNSIIWFGPNINGLSWHAQYGVDRDDPNDWGIQVNYTQGPLYLVASFDRFRAQRRDEVPDDVDAIKVAGSYNFGQGTTIIAMVENLRNEDIHTRDAAVYLGATHRINTTTFQAAVAWADDVDEVSSSGATYLALGVSHNPRQDVELYALVSYIDNDSNGAYQFISAPHTSRNRNTEIAAAGDDSWAVGLGIKYHFSANLLP